MSNVENQMSKESRSPKNRTATNPSSFGFWHSSFLRHLSFVIRHFISRERRLFLRRHRPVLSVRIWIGLANPVITLAMQFLSQSNAAGFDDPPAEHYVSEVGLVVL